MADINLIPQQVKKEQAKKQAVKSTTLVSILLLVAVVVVTGFLFLRNLNTKNQISNVESNIAGLRSDINAMADVEVVARNLDTKYTTLKTIMESRFYYDILMSEFDARIPSNVEIDTFATGRDNTMNISGSGENYIAIAQFVQNLSDQNFEDAGAGLGGLFTNVTLNSVNLDAQSSDARFFIVITVNPELLTQ